ncbi:hypothetical protein Q0F99_07165 [Rathayibacter oskolensis]|uniref:hypothetical protein n=1 Tax=Rathayibacter oskolensis TaxID=1891671 RepID=UPI00265D7BE6|nr:hypothetical protein [Rathayibacter oskolensis]WKK72696.1 hypothetical protein Q0F99_07165 [Rathayibacter oskolensis]
MRTQSPLSVITPTVDGDVLAVLARADQAFTISEIRSLVGGRSPRGSAGPSRASRTRGSS